MTCLELLGTDAGFVFLSLVFAWLLAGILKYVFSLSKKDHGSLWQEFRHSGGMPSQHSAMVTALSVSVFIVEGFTTLFVVTFAFALLVMYDAMNVRYSVGKQAELLLELAKKAKVKTAIKIVKGHTFQEVLVGIAVGLLISGMAFFLL